jgi:plastocyanin
MRSTLALAAVLAGLALGAGPALAAPRTATIVVDKLAFGPAPTGLRVGDTVQWVNRDIFQHSATAVGGAFDVELKPGATGKVVLKHAGAIDYVCRYHPGMKGRLVVH